MATEFDEPHNGHTLWRYEFYIEEQLVKNHIVGGDHTGLYPNLEHFEMESEDGNFIFIPKEEIVIYEVDTKQYHRFSTPGHTNNSFIGNRFTEGRLVVTLAHSLVIVNLQNMSAQSIVLPSKKYQLREGYYVGDILIVKYLDLQTYSEETKHYNFDKMQFD